MTVPGGPAGPGSPFWPSAPGSPGAPLGTPGPIAPIVAVMKDHSPSEVEAVAKDCTQSEYDPAGSAAGSTATMAVGAMLSTLRCTPPRITTGVAPTPKLRPPMKS